MKKLILLVAVVWLLTKYIESNPYAFSQTVYTEPNLDQVNLSQANLNNSNAALVQQQELLGRRFQSDLLMAFSHDDEVPTRGVPLEAIAPGQPMDTDLASLPVNRCLHAALDRHRPDTRRSTAPRQPDSAPGDD